MIVGEYPMYPIVLRVNRVGCNIRKSKLRNEHVGISDYFLIWNDIEKCFVTEPINDPSLYHVTSGHDVRVYHFEIDRY